MTRRTGFFLGSALGLALSALVGCGTAVKAPNGTSLFVTVRWNADTSIYALYFTGQVEGRDAFPRSYRPETFPSTPLSVPEKVRVLLADDLVGQAVTVEVYGYDQDGNLKAFGQAVSPAIVANDEVTLTVLLDQAYTPDDAGVTDAGAPDAGTKDGGTATDGGSGPPDAGCGCTTGCCSAVGKCAAPAKVAVASGVTVTAAPCGPANSMCGQICDPMLANACVNGACACGTGPACGGGQRCADKGGGTFGCICDLTSNCKGCCKSNQCVATGTNSPDCGNAGNQCQQCSGGAVCNSNGACVGGTNNPTCGTNQCRTDEQCYSMPTPSFPTCRSTTSVLGVCVACDGLRADRCTSFGTCACGVSGTCAQHQYCDRTGGAAAAKCVALP